MLLPSDTWSIAHESVERRDRLIQFWLSAPSDHLEELWRLPYGLLTQQYIRNLNPTYTFTDEQIKLRNLIGERLDQIGLNSPLAVQLMIVNFLLSPPGLLKINNIDSFFPSWFCDIYFDLYSNNQSNADSPLPKQDESPDAPDFGPFPQSLQDLIANRIHLNRLLGLSNLYYIDPDDVEIRNELQQVRTSLASLIKHAPEASLEQFWSSDFGDRYWSLVRSGIQKESLSGVDAAIKEESVQALNPDNGGGFGKPGSLNSFLIAMMYFLPGTMQVPEPGSKLPSWLLSSYISVFAKAIDQ